MTNEAKGNHYMEKNNEKELNINIALFLKKFLLLILLVLLVGIFGVFGANFFTLSNIKAILIQSTYTMIISMGLSLVIITGGMDLSVGYIISLCSSLYGVLYIKMGMSSTTAILTMIVASLLMGTLNGYLWTKIKVHALIITLSAQTLFRGLSYIISKSESMLGVDPIVIFFGSGTILGIPFNIILTVFLLLLTAFMLTKTYFGRKLYTTGGNEEVARLSGANVTRLRISAFAICGFSAGIASMILMGRSTIASPTIGPGTEITCITACLLGGVTIGGGRGNVFNVALATIVLTMLANGMTALKMDTYWQYVAKAMILVFAISFDKYTQHKSARTIKPAH